METTETCKYIMDPVLPIYNTQCGGEMEEHDVRKCGYKFCPYCGKSIEILNMMEEIILKNDLTPTE